jgi:hypothetical protein
MPSRRRASADLFRRSEAEWTRILGRIEGAAGRAAIPAVGIGTLIDHGELTPAEETMIRAVHAGEATNEHLDDAPHRVAHYMQLLDREAQHCP